MVCADFGRFSKRPEPWSPSPWALLAIAKVAPAIEGYDPTRPSPIGARRPPEWIFQLGPAQIAGFMLAHCCENDVVALASLDFAGWRAPRGRATRSPLLFECQER
jgi:hypothetical protein